MKVENKRVAATHEQPAVQTLGEIGMQASCCASGNHDAAWTILNNPRLLTTAAMMPQEECTWAMMSAALLRVDTR